MSGSKGCSTPRLKAMGGRTESHPTNRASTISRMADLRDGLDSLGEHTDDTAHLEALSLTGHASS